MGIEGKNLVGNFSSFEPDLGSEDSHDEGALPFLAEILADPVVQLLPLLSRDWGESVELGVLEGKARHGRDVDGSPETLEPPFAHRFVFSSAACLFSTSESAVDDVESNKS